ncbi:uncharacterized protein I206_103509 [Kwoniella pini CBS 10737]|uniref:Uncharacterized protein n=1 Tax=Kwoniella pini CBS 10737 TaxID=1296096 RepID=A0A1B9I9B0_9TREE|nr:uncharacterized protein I206_01487 [Kwoniella pini CBS 10737]OCF52202.1 hypothetical protein I206_01487 [Kwoniella pini CBS 10737]
MKFILTFFFIISLFLITQIQISNAKVYNIELPKQIIIGSNINIIVSSSSYIQNWNDFGIIWGILNENHECNGCIGQEIGYENLYDNNFIGNLTYSIKIPNLNNGSYTFIAAVPYLVGISGETGINYFNQSINLISDAKMRI